MSMKQIRQASTARKTIRIFVSYWLKEPVLLMLSLLLAPAYVLQNVICPLFIAKVVSQLAAHHPVTTAYLWWATAALLGGVLLNYIVHYRYEPELNVNGIRALHEVILRKLLAQEYGFFADNFAGALVARTNRFVKAFELFTYTVFLDMLGLLCGVLVALGIMIHYSMPLGLVITALWLFSVVFVIRMAIRRMPLRRSAVAKETEQIAELADIVTNAITVKTFAREAAEQKRYHRTNWDRAALFLRSWRRAANNNFLIQILCAVMQLTVLIGGVWSIQHHRIDVGLFLLFQVYALRIIDSIAKSSIVVRQFEGALGDSHEMTEMYDRQPTIADAQKPEPSRIEQGAIEFRGVDFSYSGSKQSKNANTVTLLHDFNLLVKPGEKVGLVGPSGGGKTTLTKLLLRFDDIQRGAILIDGQDIRTIKQDDLHEAISYVPQEPLLFHRSIAENIGYGDVRAQAQAIERAAHQAHADEFIAELPGGYDTLVGERGIKLSGGQRQRVAIARAMLKQAPILILDEATSALDSESEQFIQEGLWELMKDKTAIVIAHRLSTIQRMDRIVVLDRGKIVEQGTHAELLKQKGLYAKLWTHQSGGFLKEFDSE